MTRLYNTDAFAKYTRKNSQLHENIVCEYSKHLLSEYERVMFECFNAYKKDFPDESYSQFEKKHDLFDGDVFGKYYPLAEEMFHKRKVILEKSLCLVLDKYEEDRQELFQAGLISTESTRLADINIGMGDFHNGQSTTILVTENGDQLIYKPNDGAITSAFNMLIDWLNNYSDHQLQQYVTVNKQTHHWQEFVEYEKLNSEKEVSAYYYRAGLTACIAYVLNSVDFHFENLIVNGSSPVLIDHETIIQPRFNEELKQFFKVYEMLSSDSVLDSMLLPNKTVRTGIPKGMCGFGLAEERYASGWQKKSINAYSDDWKFVTRVEQQDFFKNNIPVYREEQIYPHQYLGDMTAGFEDCYRILMENRKQLMSADGVLHNFENKPVRFVWRATNVYYKILEFMKLPKNLVNKEEYQKKIRDYLSIAFKNVPAESQLLNILESELVDMYEGDVPYFEVSSSSRNLKTKSGEIKDFFELSGVENIHRKLRKLSEDDLAYQKKLMIQCYTSGEMEPEEKNHTTDYQAVSA